MRRSGALFVAALAAAVLLLGGLPAWSWGASAPEVRLTTLTDGQAVAGPTQVSVVATTSSGPGTLQITVDGAAVHTATPWSTGGDKYAFALVWDARSVPNGTHVIGAKLTDAASATAEATVSVSVQNPSVNVGVSPATISPNKDGKADSASVTYTLATAANVTIVVKDKRDVIMAWLVNGENKAEGQHAVSWDGLRNGRPDVPNGAYTIEVWVTHLGQTVRETATVRVLVSKARARTWPSRATFSPNGDGSADTVRIRVRLYDWSYVTVGVYSSTGRLVRTLRRTALMNRRTGNGYSYIWNGRDNRGRLARPGAYVIKVITRNQAGGALHRNTVRIRGPRMLLLIRSLIRLYFLEGNDPLPGPKWADWRLNGQKVAVFPIAVGMPGWTTPAGKTYVENKKKWPTWYPPPWAGMSGPVSPGRRNPLGPRALYLSPRGYDDGIRIHGTNNPSSIGTRASHGCVRMYPKDVIWLYDRVPIGTRVVVTQKLPRGIPLVGPRKPAPGKRRWY